MGGPHSIVDNPSAAATGADIFAATRVVSLIPGDGTDLTIAAAIAALPAAGGCIYIKQGVYPLAASLVVTNKPIKFIGSGRNATILDLGAVAIPAFTLGFNNKYTFEDFTIRGTGLVGQQGWLYSGGIVSPLTQRCLRVRTEAIEKVLKVAAAPLSFAFFEFISCELETSGLVTAAIVDAVASGGARVFAIDTSMAIEFGNAGGFFGTVEPQFVRCIINVFNGATFSGGGENPILTNCNFIAIAAPIVIALGGYRIIGCRFNVALVGVTALTLTAGGAVVAGNDFSVPVGAITINVPSSFNIIENNANCRVLESGGANNNRYADNTLFQGSTIIGPKSIVTDWNALTVAATPFTLDESHRTIYSDTAGGARVLLLPDLALSRHRRYTIKKIAAANTTTITPFGAQTIEGAATLVLVANDEAVEIQADTVAGTWRVVAGKGAPVSTGASREPYQFGRSGAVPGGGTLQLFGPGSTTTGFRMDRPGTITGGSIQVNVVDAVRAYKLSIRVNGVEVALVALPVATLGASSVALAVAVVAGDLLTAFMVLTAGAGASTFTDTIAMIEVTV